MAAAGVDWLQTDRAEEILRGGPQDARGRAAEDRPSPRGRRYAPENTLPALEKSIRLGADFVEFDVRTTRDGQFILLHDGTSNRTTEGRGPVRDRSEAEVLALDAGAWFGRHSGEPVAGLDEFLGPRPSGRAYVRRQGHHPQGPRRGACASTDWSSGPSSTRASATSKSFAASSPRLRRMPPLRDPAKLDDTIERVKPYAFDTQWSILSKDLIDRCHARGVLVFSDALGLHESIAHYRGASATEST